ncbi:MAG: AI-2E family transporter [Ruminococcus sp.]|nr:AI-2E family transporter [Ruminococcus sp.]
MKKVLTLKNVLICIFFTVFLLVLKDNLDIIWDLLVLITETITPFLIGFLIAYILNFPYKLFYSKLFKNLGKKTKFFQNLRKPLSIICTYTVVIAIVVFLISILVPQITSNITNLVQNLPGYFQSLYNDINDFIQWINDTFNAGIDEDNAVNDMLNSALSYFTAENITKILGFAGDTTTVIINFITNTVGGLYNFVLGIIISVYFLSAKENLCRQIKKLTVGFIPIRYLPKIYEIVDITDTKCGRYLIGEIIDAGVIGILTFILMTIFGIPYAPLIAVIIGVTNLIPFFGPFIGAIPSALLLFMVDPIAMIKFIVIVFVMQQLDGNIIKPKIVGDQVGLSSFWVLFSVLIGGAFFGIPGLILGTPIYAVIYTLVAKKVNKAIKEKGKIAQEALDFEVLRYTKIAEEQRRKNEIIEQQKREKLIKIMHLDKLGVLSDDDDADEKSEADE